MNKASCSVYNFGILYALAILDYRFHNHSMNRRVERICPSLVH